MPLAVCATPIGNLRDVTLRVLDELREADVVLCEDTRHTRLLLDRHGISARLLSLHEHNEAERTAEVLPRLEAGERIAARVGRRDAGDLRPGGAARAGGARGGSPGVGAAGALGGRDGARRERARRATATPSSGSCRAAPASSPPCGRSFAAPSGRWWRSSRRGGCRRRSRRSRRRSPEREVAVCRELTKAFEEVVRGAAHEVAEAFAEPPKGEITLVIGPGAGGAGRGRRRRGAAGGGRPRRGRDAAEGRGGGGLPPHPRGSQRALPLDFVTKQ